jgi:hypothetical protein
MSPGFSGAFLLSEFRPYGSQKEALKGVVKISKTPISGRHENFSNFKVFRQSWKSFCCTKF